MPRIQRHTLSSQIHADAHFVVYRGVRDEDNQPVLARLLAHEYPSAEHIAELRHEHAIETQLELDGVAKPLALELHGHGVALVWQDPGGVTLRSLLEQGPLELTLALRIATSLARTLAGVHEASVIHKRLSPDEIFVEVETGRSTLFGFGVATRLSRETPKLASAASLEGELAYLAPELSGRMNRIVDRRSDLYSLGALVYHMLTGAPPFAAQDSVELLYCHLARRPEPPRSRVPELPEQVSELTLKLLEKNAEDRYQYARSVAADLERCLAQLEGREAPARFELGEGDRDRGAELDIPQRLYGREAELRALHEAWARIAAGAVELLIVRGYSGIGKSVLVHEIHRELTGARGYFVAGKFDQLGRASPYAAIAAALRELVHALLTEPEAELERVRDQLAATLGDDVAVLLELVPDLARVLGPAAPAAPQQGAGSRKRLTRAVQLLLRACTGAGRPLVLFLDDLQWADLASLDLLEALLATKQGSHLLVIGAYRSNEVDGSHPLTSTLAAIAEAATLGVIELGPLARGDVLRFVADTLAMEVEAVASLAALVYDRTEGNPFFLIQLLRALHDDGLLRYDSAARRYRWDDAAIREIEATDNVVSFMAERLERLPAPTRRALELAACIGHRFELDTLATICTPTPISTPSAISTPTSSAMTLAADLWEALEAGVIVALDASYRLLQLDDQQLTVKDTRPSFRFLHDRVQQAAYARIEPDQRAAVHLRIGRMLLADTSRAESEHSFEIVAHLNIGRELITDAEERKTLARLNLAAGTRARAATAYAAASDTFAAGASMLAADAFDRDYALAFGLRFGEAEAAMLAGDHERSAALVDELLARAKSPLDEARLFDLRAVSCVAQGRSAEAVEAGVAGLRRLGFDVPETDEQRREAYELELAVVVAHIDAADLQQLARAPEMDAPAMRVALELARHTALSAFGVATTLGYWLTALAARLSLAHGSSDQASSAYALLGAVLASSTKRYAEAFELVKLALAVHEVRGGGVHEACMLGFYFTTVSHYSMHWRELLPYLDRARLAGVESGDQLFHSYTCSHLAIARLILGDPLDELRGDVERMLARMQADKLASAAATQAVVRQTIACLEGRTKGPSSLSDDATDEAELLATIEAANMSFAHYWYRTTKGALLYLDDDPAGALASLEPLTRMIPIAFTPEARWFTALALLALDRDARLEHIALVERCERDLEIWAEACPANYRHRLLLVEAEAARVAGEHERAMVRYDEAIDAAQDQDWPRDLGLANERAARYYLERGRERIARAYMTDAAYAYARWGAVARVRGLAQRFPGLIPIEVQLSSYRGQPHARGGIAPVADEVDMLAFARSLQSIAREVILDNVVERMLQVVLRSAGAERAVLLLLRDGDPIVYAQVTADPPLVSVALASTLDDSPDLPATMIRYALRTSEPVVIDDASVDERFAGDPYIARARPRSVACLTLTHQGRSKGVLYLENNAATAAFTRRRLELLELLSAQAVISIDNAELYARVQAVKEQLAQANADLEAEVSEQTRQLRRTNERLNVELRERAEAEAERARIQAERLAELSTPVIPFSREILIMPMIGSLDRERVEQILDAALAATQARGASVVIFDVTGLKHVDRTVADTLVSATSVLRLLGASVIVTGVGPAMALAMIEGSADLGRLTTCTTLEQGVRAAVARVAAPRASARG